MSRVSPVRLRFDACNTPECNKACSRRFCALRLEAALQRNWEPLHRPARGEILATASHRLVRERALP